MLNNWVTEAEEKNPQTNLLIVHEIPEDLVDDFAKVYTETMNLLSRQDIT